MILNNLIAQGEGPNLEFKETLFLNTFTSKEDQKITDSSLKTIAAFLNTNGGILLIGVSDKGEIKGIECDYQFCKKGKQDNEGFELKFRDILNSRLKPYPLDNITIDLKDRPVCRVDILPSPIEIYLDNTIYRRDGNRNLKLEGSNLVNWIKSRNANAGPSLTASQREKLENIGETIVDVLREIISQGSVENQQISRLRNAIKDNSLSLGQMSDYLEGVLRTVTALELLEHDTKNSARALNAHKIYELKANLGDEVSIVKKKFREILDAK